MYRELLAFPLCPPQCHTDISGAFNAFNSYGVKVSPQGSKFQFCMQNCSSGSPLTAGESHCFYRCIICLCSTDVYVYTKKSTSKGVFKKDTYYCLFSKCILILFIFKKVALHFMKYSNVEIVIIWRSCE